METLRKLADHARNYHEYRSRLRNTAPPAVPFLGEISFLVVHGPLLTVISRIIPHRPDILS